MSLSPAWLDELRARVSLSGVIGRTTPLTKAGREFKACCPFHAEKTPSFTVNDEKGFYHCFGCGAHGDVIRWLTDQRGLAFIDAVKDLAGEAGLELPAPDPRAAAKAEERRTLHDALAAAQQWFVASLNRPEGAAARAYLDRRGVPPALVERFGFGFAPGGRQALRQALPGFSEALLVEAGLRIEAEGREPYDRFRGRLTLPIRNPRGTVIGFNGRILDAGATDAPKYLNSPDTPVFDKGRTLYNLDRAGPLARTSGRLVVVEGTMDVVALAAAGIDKAVAPLGTALTEAQIELLWRACETPVLCFDGDAAGQRAATRAMLRALPLLRPGHSLKIAVLPPGLDPDDFVKAHGAAALLDRIAAARPLVEALWEAERDAASLVTPEDKAALKARLLAHVETIQHPDIGALYRRELLARFSAFAFPPRQPGTWRSSTRAAGERLSPGSAQRLRRMDGDDSTLLAAVVAGLLRWPDEIARHADALAPLRPAERGLAALVDFVVELGDSNTRLETADIARILGGRGLRPPGPADYAHLPFAFLADGVEIELAAETLAQAVGHLTVRPAIESAILAASDRFASDPEGAIAEQARLRNRKLASQRDLMQGATARAGNEQEANERHGGDRKD
ncbi:MAG: DNA primase [Novosphingobium sp.]